MAEPARFPTPRPRKPPVTPAETPASPGPVEPPGSRTQGLSRLPRDELLALAERDLPAIDDLAPYESLGVSEYSLFDPVGGLLEPRLQGHVLRDGRYRPMRLERLPNGERG